MTTKVTFSKKNFSATTLACSALLNTAFTLFSVGQRYHKLSCPDQLTSSLLGLKLALLLVTHICRPAH
jgi:hypothetical protein